MGPNFSDDFGSILAFSEPRLPVEPKRQLKQLFHASDIAARKQLAVLATWWIVFLVRRQLKQTPIFRSHAGHLSDRDASRLNLRWIACNRASRKSRKGHRRPDEVQSGRMPVPTFHINISGSVVSAYAAVVATATGAVQLFNFLRDRARVKVSARHDMRIMGDPRYSGKTLTIVTVMNAGRRPVTITTVGATTLHPHPHFIIVECQPSLPHELTEGKNLIAILPPCDIDFSTIESWEAWDAVGRPYRSHVAPWYARAISHAKRRREWRRKAATIKA